MRKFTIILIALIFITFGATATQAATIGLYDWALNINGAITLPGDSLPGFIDASGFDFTTGLGTIGITYNPGVAGSYSLLAFFDYEIDEVINTFFNETGATSGTPATGQSWEIDEPGFVNGDIYENFQMNTLDNGVGTSIYGDTIFPDDVSMAMGWDFSLGPLDYAVIDFIISDSVTPSGFFLSQTDPDSDATVYFSSNLDVEVIPEPATILLLGSGLAGLVGFGRKRFMKMR